MMKAWVLNSIGDIEYKDIDMPSVSEDEELVKVKAAGICGSDIPRIYKNGAHKMPLVLGHEFSGELVKAGNKVGIFPLIPCKKCKPCQLGKYEMCKSYNYLGSRCDGGFAEYVSVPKWNIIKLPDNVSAEAAAMLEPMAVSVHAMRRIINENTDKNSTVLIYGLGTIGLLLTMFLIDYGMNNILVIGNKEFQKKAAINMGIPKENYCDAKTQDVKNWVLKKTEDYGADILFECIGKNETISLVIDMAAPSANICMVGNPYSDMKFDQNTYWKILRLQLNVTGTWNSSFTGGNLDADASDIIGTDVVFDDWRYVINRLSLNKINPEKFITHRLRPDELNKGFEIMKNKTDNFVKIMMVQ